VSVAGDASHAVRPCEAYQSILGNVAAAAALACEMVHFLDELPLDQAIEALVESINEALAGYSGGVSEDACEPYGGWVEADGDVLRVRYGRVPFSHPDDGRRAPELPPIPLSAFVTEDNGEL
jgi:hypothetical protein